MGDRANKIIIGLKALAGRLRKYRWTLAFVGSCLLIFTGPTYVVWALYQLDMSWPVPDLVGFALFAVGLIATAYLISSPRTEGER